MKKLSIIAGVLLIFVAGAGWVFMKNNVPENVTQSTSKRKDQSFVENNPLPIPPLVKDEDPNPNKAEFTLTAQKSTMEFIKGKDTETYGYNGDFLGPVIRVKRGENVSVKVKNKLDEPTTIHWHGLQVKGEQDGGPHTGIEPGTTWNPEFTVDQPAATLWYHPHFLHKTGEHVYKGLAGLFYIDDEVSENLDIPKDYGINDVPLVIQDKNFGADGDLDYHLNMHDVMMGLQGDTILVNGAIQPYFEVPKGKVRLRLLNGSNARNYSFKLSNEQTFYQIASDGGLLESPVEMTSVFLSPAERAEIIVDFSNFKKGATVQLTDAGTPLMKFVVTEKEMKEISVPKKLADISKIDQDKAVKTRKFVLQGTGENVNINGKPMDMDRIDEIVKLHDTEIWEISNDGMGHPFHVHGVQFQILDRDGNPPPVNETGWKDTIFVNSGEKVRIIATFNKPGLFMYHCHILEHEDTGMMGQFKVE